MRSPILASGFTRKFRSLTLLALLLSLGMGLAYSFGADRLGQLFRKKRVVVVEKKEPVARCLSKDGSLIRQEAGSTSWKTVAHNEELFEGDLIVSGGGGQLETLDSSIVLTFRGDVGGTSPLPVRETAVRLVGAREKGVDFHVNFERGRIEITNAKKSGPALCHIRILAEEEDFSEVKLNEPGASSALEILGRWPRGTHFSTKAKTPVQPVYELIYVQLKGTSEVTDEGVTHHMSAPPGPAMLVWNSQAGLLPVKSKLEKLPDWALPPDLTKPEIAAKIKSAMKFRDEFFHGKTLDQVLISMVESREVTDRFIGVNVILATDQLGLLFKAIAETKNQDVIDNAIIGLRHWVGRMPGQDKKLHEFMMSSRQYTSKQAEIFVDLLHSFSEDELKHPETFEALIDYMESERTGIRGLAHWHLYRLVPKGREFKYDPTDSVEKRKAAIDQWKKLIPKGKLPPRSID